MMIILLMIYSFIVGYFLRSFLPSFIHSFFLPVRRYASAGLCDSNVSVRLSVTRRYCVKTMISSPSGSPTILVF